MKKSILLTLSIVALAVLAVSFSGCLASGDDEPAVIDHPAVIQSVIYYTLPVNGDNITADILVQIQGTYSQSIDHDNITVTVIGDKIYVNVPVINDGVINTMDLGYETVSVNLGTKDELKDGTYTVIVNYGTDREFTSPLKIENGELYYYKPGTVNDIIVEADGNNVTVHAVIVLAGSAETVDTENITASGKFDENGRYEIYIPTQVKDGITTLNLIYAPESFIIGQLNEMADGTYTVSVNGVETAFAVENGQLSVIA